MASLKAVRNALARQIQAYTYPALPAEGNPGDQINPPGAFVLPPRGTFATYGQTLGSTAPYLGAPVMPVLAATAFSLDVLVIVPRTIDIQRTQENLDAWFGYENEPGVTVSVPMAVAMDDTLGGNVAWCVPESADAYGPVAWNGVDYFGARIHFSISLV